jgi:biotin carboxyl carrier protein
LKERNHPLKLQIKINGKIYEAEVDILEDDEEQSQPTLPVFHPVPVTYAPVAAASGSHAPDAAAYGGEEKVLRSPVTGLVDHILVRPGQVVAKGELLLVLESMKMETNVTAPRAGTIAAIAAQQGHSVKTGDILVAFA